MQYDEMFAGVAMNKKQRGIFKNGLETIQTHEEAKRVAFGGVPKLRSVLGIIPFTLMSLCQGIGLDMIATTSDNLSKDYVTEKPSFVVSIDGGGWSEDRQDRAWQLEEIANAGTTVLHLDSTHECGGEDKWMHFQDGSIKVHHGRGNVSFATNSEEVAGLVYVHVALERRNGSCATSSKGTQHRRLRRPTEASSSDRGGGQAMPFRVCRRV